MATEQSKHPPLLEALGDADIHSALHSTAQQRMSTRYPNMLLNLQNLFDRPESKNLKRCGIDPSGRRSQWSTVTGGSKKIPCLTISMITITTMFNFLTHFGGTSIVHPWWGHGRAMNMCSVYHVSIYIYAICVYVYICIYNYIYIDIWYIYILCNKYI